MNPQELEKFRLVETLKSFSELNELIHDKIYTAKDVDGVTSRNLNHWNLKGLLLDEREDEKGWNYFNFVDVIWVRIFLQLREFGLPLELLKKIKKKLLVRHDVMEMVNISDIKINKKTKQHLDEKTERIKTKVAKEINEKALDELPFKIATKFSVLALGIMEYIIWRKHITFVITKEGDVYLWNEFEHQNYVDAGIDIKYKHHISISLPKIMQDFILDDKHDEKYPRLGIISEQESEVIKLLRKKQIKTLTIRIKDEKINLLETTESFDKVSAAGRFTEHILKGGYQDISFSTQEGKIVNFQKTTKYKFS